MNFDHKEFAPRIVLQSIPIWKEYWIPLATAAFLLITSQSYCEFNKIFDFPIVYQLHDLHSLHNPKKYEMRNWLKRNQIGFSIMRWSMDDFLCIYDKCICSCICDEMVINVIFHQNVEYSKRVWCITFNTPSWFHCDAFDFIRFHLKISISLVTLWAPNKRKHVETSV